MSSTRDSPKLRPTRVRVIDPGPGREGRSDQDKLDRALGRLEVIRQEQQQASFTLNAYARAPNKLDWIFVEEQGEDGIWRVQAYSVVFRPESRSARDTPVLIDARPRYKSVETKGVAGVAAKGAMLFVRATSEGVEGLHAVGASDALHLPEAMRFAGLVDRQEIETALREELCDAFACQKGVFRSGVHGFGSHRRLDFVYGQFAQAAAPDGTLDPSKLAQSGFSTPVQRSLVEHFRDWFASPKLPPTKLSVPVGWLVGVALESYGIPGIQPDVNVEIDLNADKKKNG